MKDEIVKVLKIKLFDKIQTWQQNKEITHWLKSFQMNTEVSLNLLRGKQGRFNGKSFLKKTTEIHIIISGFK